MSGVTFLRRSKIWVVPFARAAMARLALANDLRVELNDRRSSHGDEAKGGENSGDAEEDWRVYRSGHEKSPSVEKTIMAPVS